jgi:YidC/Oxa1 family membrane protein insertase
MTKQVGLMMTFMFGFFTLQVPAGLTLYWVTSNLLQMFQQWFITSGRFGLGSSSSTSAGTVAEISTTAQDSTTSVATTSTNGAEPVTTTNTPKRRRRRRAKRR